MAPKKQSAGKHQPVFKGIKAIFVPSDYGITRVSWVHAQTRFTDLHGILVSDLSDQPTHVVAGTWLSVMAKWSWNVINSAIAETGLKIVDTTWLVHSIARRRVQSTESYELWESEEATLDAQSEEKE